MTAPQAPFRGKARREDVLVSVCFADLPATRCAFDAVATLAQALGVRFRFREIVVVTEESRKDSLLALVQRIENLRLFTVRNGTPLYRRRVIALNEAIGDVVMVSNAAELPHIDPVALLEQSADNQHMVLVTRPARLSDRMLAGPILALGRLAGFKVSTRNLQSMAAPRNLLNQLLTHPDPDLALRFPPRDVQLPLASAIVAPKAPRLRQAGYHGQRLVLLQKLLVYIAPSLLMAVTMVSALLAISGFAYGLYTLGAWIVVSDLAPGWITLSAMLSLTAFFLGISIMGLSLGIQKLLALAGRSDFEGVTSEINRVDLFDQVASDLNVDLQSSNDSGVATGRKPR